MDNNKIFKYLIVLALTVGCVPGCSKWFIANADPIPGTETVLVIISLDKEENPEVNYEVVEVSPKQTLVFVGPKEFTLRFEDVRPLKIDDVYRENQKCQGEFEVCTDDSVIIIDVKGVEDEEFKDRKMDLPLDIKYDVIVGKKVLDPYVRIIER